MEFSLIGGLVAGFVATAIMSTMMRLVARSGITEMPPMELVTGAMLTDDHDRATRIGTVIHWVMMGTVAFGLGYAALFTAFGSASVGTGILLGVAHGTLVGVVFLPMMPAMHPRMGGGEPAGGLPASAVGVHLTAPGFFGTHWGRMTPVGLVMGHLVYGLVFALIYQAFV